MQYEYDSWNRIQSYTFSANEKDSETGLSYFGSRYYSSDLCIWLSVDPQSDKYASLSPYVYCANNPVKLVDPNGEEVVLETIYKKDANGNDTKDLSQLLPILRLLTRFKMYAKAII